MIRLETESCRSPRTASVRTYVSSLDRTAGTFCVGQCPNGSETSELQSKRRKTAGV
jgi:hypothetical protein